MNLVTVGRVSVNANERKVVTVDITFVDVLLTNATNPRTDLWRKLTQRLHGIVYHENSPFLLAILRLLSKA